MDFPTTIWTVIRAAARESPGAADDVARRYYPAVASFLRLHGFAPADREDLTQEVFLRIFGEKILTRAEAARGRFRSLLIAVTKQVMFDELRRRSAKKRGGEQQAVAIDPETAMTRPVEDEEFDRAWAANLSSLALKRLREECETTGRSYHAALQGHLEGKSYAQIAGELASDVTNVRNWIRRAKLRLREHIDEEIRAYSSSSEEYRDEARYLARFLGSEAE